MVGTNEATTTYPQFFRLANGNLLFTYREGSSGNGNVVLDRYDTRTKAWTRVYTNLIDGQGARNPYTQMQIDPNGVIHLSWVWRETADVATNHDMCYARSRDDGATWEKSTGEKYAIPINATTAEYAAKIAQSSELINQTSIYGDEKSRPYIATYWAPSSGIPQYQLIYNTGSAWKTVQISNRTMDFSLSGTGTKKIPISRPQIMVDGGGDSIGIYMVFRDTERNSKVSLAHTSNLGKTAWTTTDLTTYTVDSWEPTFDTERWKTSHVLDLFVQRMGQGDGETLANLAPQTVTVLEWKPPASTGLAKKESVSRDRELRRDPAIYDMAGRRRSIDPSRQILTHGVPRADAVVELPGN